MSAAKALDRNPLREVVRCSYSGVYVDEYQDCTIPQHDLILKLAEVLPCRILGDPLQGIFDFRKNECVDWDQHVSPNFEALPEMDRYWRWEKANRRLGSWLTWFRKKVVAGGSVDLRNGPVTWRNSDRYIIPISESLRIARTDDESVVAIHQWPTQCHAMAGKLKNVFTCIEPIDCGDLFETAQKFEETSGLERARAVLHFACDCMTQVGTHLSAVRKALEDGREPKVGRGAHSEEIKALLEIALNSSYEPVLRALKKMRELPNVVLRRGELYSEMLRALDEFNKGKYDSLSEAAWHVRNRTRQMGRRPIRCTVGRTVLVKGLEFDHCIVFDAENLEKKNLYVAFTRGSKSLAVFSKTPILTLK
jgi:DNA helicase-2/ATP-dependent DNA helicase PcrA